MAAPLVVTVRPNDTQHTPQACYARATVSPHQRLLAVSACGLRTVSDGQQLLFCGSRHCSPISIPRSSETDIHLASWSSHSSSVASAPVHAVAAGLVNHFIHVDPQSQEAVAVGHVICAKPVKALAWHPREHNVLAVITQDGVLLLQVAAGPNGEAPLQTTSAQPVPGSSQTVTLHGCVQLLGAVPALGGRPCKVASIHAAWLSDAAPAGAAAAASWLAVAWGGVLELLCWQPKGLGQGPAAQQATPQTHKSMVYASDSTAQHTAISQPRTANLAPHADSATGSVASMAATEPAQGDTKSSARITTASGRMQADVQASTWSLVHRQTVTLQPACQMPGTYRALTALPGNLLAVAFEPNLSLTNPTANITPATLSSHTGHRPAVALTHGADAGPGDNAPARHVSHISAVSSVSTSAAHAQQARVLVTELSSDGCQGVVAGSRVDGGRSDGPGGGVGGPRTALITELQGTSRGGLVTELHGPLHSGEASHGAAGQSQQAQRGSPALPSPSQLLQGGLTATLAAMGDADSGGVGDADVAVPPARVDTRPKAVPDIFKLSSPTQPSGSVLLVRIHTAHVAQPVAAGLHSGQLGCTRSAMQVTASVLDQQPLLVPRPLYMSVYSPAGSVHNLDTFSSTNVCRLQTEPGRQGVGQRDGPVLVALSSPAGPAAVQLVRLAATAGGSASGPPTAAGGEDAGRSAVLRLEKKKQGDNTSRAGEHTELRVLGIALQACQGVAGSGGLKLLAYQGTATVQPKVPYTTVLRKAGVQGTQLSSLQLCEYNVPQQVLSHLGWDALKESPIGSQSHSHNLAAASSLTAAKASSPQRGPLFAGHRTDIAGGSQDALTSVRMAIAQTRAMMCQKLAQMRAHIDQTERCFDEQLRAIEVALEQAVTAGNTCKEDG